jgi:hypothetical protein
MQSYTLFIRKRKKSAEFSLFYDKKTLFMFTPLFRKIHQINRVKEYPNAFLLIFFAEK